jgi:DNA invertase Pin-like site-specific DNA recombinase
MTRFQLAERTKAGLEAARARGKLGWSKSKAKPYSNRRLEDDV